MHQFVLPFLAAIATQPVEPLIRQPDVKPSMDMLKCVFDKIMPDARSDKDVQLLVDAGMAECRSYHAPILEAVTEFVTQGRPEAATLAQLESARKLADGQAEVVRSTANEALTYLRAHPNTPVE